MTGNTVSGDDRALRQQAVRLTEAVFLKMKPRPQRPVEKVAPVVYALLLDDIEPKTIERALIMARAHTADGISYALRQIMPGVDTTIAPKYPDIPAAQKWDPSPDEKARAKATIAEIRERLRGIK